MTASTDHIPGVGKKPRPPYRPRRDPTAARVVRSYSVHPLTADKIAGEAVRSGQSQGQVVDRLARKLKVKG